MPDRHHFSGAPVIWPEECAGREDVAADTDFPYDYAKHGHAPDTPHMLHADEVIMVRTLGGWNPEHVENASEFDLVYRDEDGRIQLNTELTRRHFARYEESKAVKHYVIVLDNMPHSLTNTPVTHFYGQATPPDDFGEWSEFIVKFCREVKDILGGKRANQVSFRLGTEMQGRKGDPTHGRFAGSLEQFLEFYKLTANAVESVLPRAKFAPFNVAGVDQGVDSHEVNYVELARFCKDNDLPLDFIAHSLYTVPLFGRHSPLKGVESRDWNRLTNIDPAEKVKYYTDFWEELYEVNPDLKEVPREIHEYGRLANELGMAGPTMGCQLCSRDAANLYQIMMLLKKAGASKVNHWGLGAYGVGMNSNCWLLQVLDHMTGGEVWELPVENASQRSISSVLAHAFLNCDNGKSYIVVSTFSTYRYIHTLEELEVSVPDELIELGGRKLRGAGLTVVNSPHRAMRNDLAAAGLLTEDYQLHPDIMPFGGRGVIPEAVTDYGAARKLLEDSMQNYRDLLRDSLTLRPYEGKVRVENGNAILPVNTRASSVLVFEVRE